MRQYPRLESSSIIITTVDFGQNRGNVRASSPRRSSGRSRRSTASITSRAPRTRGSASVTVHLRLNHSLQRRSRRDQRALNQVRSTLPPDAESPVVDIQRPTSRTRRSTSRFTSDTLSLTQLNEYLVRQVQPELADDPRRAARAASGLRDARDADLAHPDRMDAAERHATDVWTAPAARTTSSRPSVARKASGYPGQTARPIPT